MGTTGTTATGTRDTRDAMVEEARAIVDAARERGVVLRLHGGLGVRAWCEVVAFCDRDYGDVDLIGLKAQRAAIRRFFRDRGYAERPHVSQATGGHQLQFTRPCAHGGADGRVVHPDDHVDVFLDGVRMDHELRLRDRLQLDAYTVPVSDQLLTKLQIHRQDEKDLRDVLTLLKDLEIADDEAPGVIGLRYLAARCARDWGLHHDVERNLDRAEALAARFGLSADAPKSRRWRLRARVGERLPWHREVEEQGEPSGTVLGA